jgi:hypothetical protein
MANSLKSKFPALAVILGETPDTLYGWQRALVREGLLDAAPGRGPGSGVVATPKTMAQFLIGVCCQATRVENAPLVPGVALATALGKDCTLTGKKKFADALTAILADEALASRVVQVTMAANAGGASITHDGNQTVSFWEGRRRKAPAGIQFSAMLWGTTLVDIAKELAQ